MRETPARQFSGISNSREKLTWNCLPAISRKRPSGNGDFHLRFHRYHLLFGLRGKLDLEQSLGDTSLTFAEVAGDIEVENSLGNVDLYFPP